jgi:hypothetical protein
MDWRESRLKQIEDGLQRDLELLAEYEAALRLADDPKQRLRYQNEIDQLKSAIAVKESEQQTLLAHLPQPTSRSCEMSTHRGLSECQRIVDLSNV